MITLLKIKDAESAWGPMVNINELRVNIDHTVSIIKEIIFFSDSDCFRIKITFKEPVLINNFIETYMYITYPDLPTFNIPYDRMAIASASLSFMRKRLI